MKIFTFKNMFIFEKIYKSHINNNGFLFGTGLRGMLVYFKQSALIYFLIF